MARGPGTRQPLVVGSILPDGGIEITISWELVGDDVLSEDNALIGMHVHAGNSSENGPIVWGFCGQDPLPPFRGPCPQNNTVTSVWYAGEVCDFAGPCLNDGNSSGALDTAALLSGAPMYVNIHTTKSFAANDDNPLGLIRGQLVSLGSSSGNLVHTGMTTLLVAVAALAPI